jgi:serine/threonine protein kinase
LAALPVVHTPARPADILLPPRYRLGRYTVARRLSQGGFGVVYWGTRSDGVEVAIKEFLPMGLVSRGPGNSMDVYCPSPSNQERFDLGLNAFFREADTLARFHHPKIIPIWDVFRAHGTAYLIMPVERGGTLAARMLGGKAFSLKDALQVVSEAALGVERLHSMGCLHLDMKPSNIWIRPDGTVLVLDLGASRWEDEEMQVSQMARTPGYAAPEQHSRFSLKIPTTRTIDQRTDVYGLTATLFDAVTGRPPLPANQRTAGDRPLRDLLATTLPRPLADLIEDGLALRTEFRPSSILNFRVRLDRVRSLFLEDTLLEEIPWPVPLS